MNSILPAKLRAKEEYKKQKYQNIQHPYDVEQNIKNIYDVEHNIQNHFDQQYMNNQLYGVPYDLSLEPLDLSAGSKEEKYSDVYPCKSHTPESIASSGYSSGFSSKSSTPEGSPELPTELSQESSLQPLTKSEGLSIPHNYQTIDYYSPLPISTIKEETEEDFVKSEYIPEYEPMPQFNQSFRPAYTHIPYTSHEYDSSGRSEDFEKMEAYKLEVETRRRQRQSKAYYENLSEEERKERHRQLDNERSRQYRSRKRNQKNCLQDDYERESKKHSELSHKLRALSDEIKMYYGILGKFGIHPKSGVPVEVS